MPFVYLRRPTNDLRNVIIIMSVNPKRILVPTDFTKVADCAMNHAAGLAERMGASLSTVRRMEKGSEYLPSLLFLVLAFSRLL